jgi:hypothetical protein
MREQGYDVVKERLSELLSKDMIDSQGHVAHNVSLSDLREKGFITKR